jgi:hypothetical protein
MPAESYLTGGVLVLNGVHLLASVHPTRAIYQPLTPSAPFSKLIYGTWRFTAMFTTARYWSLSWARSIQSIPYYSSVLRSILILSTHFRLSLHSVLFPSCFLINILYALRFSPFVLHALPISSSFTWSFYLYLAKSTSYEVPYCAAILFS